jgi:hypothetical protein
MVQLHDEGRTMSAPADAGTIAVAAHAAAVAHVILNIRRLLRRETVPGDTPTARR